METIQAFFHKRKRATAFFLAGAIAAVSLLPRVASAYNLNEGLYGLPEVECTWGDDSVAMKKNKEHGNKYIPTGLAFNMAIYRLDPGQLPPEVASILKQKGRWGLGGQVFLAARPGYENPEYAMFDGRHTYCSGNHESAAASRLARRRSHTQRKAIRLKICTRKPPKAKRTRFSTS